jgi:hypothetical protein
MQVIIKVNTRSSLAIGGLSQYFLNRMLNWPRRGSVPFGEENRREERRREKKKVEEKEEEER